MTAERFGIPNVILSVGANREKVAVGTFSFTKRDMHIQPDHFSAPFLRISIISIKRDKRAPAMRMISQHMNTLKDSARLV